MRQGGFTLAAGRVHSKKTKHQKTRTNTNKCAPPKTHHEVHSSPATATTSRRLATKHVPRVSPYSPASIDPGFVNIGHVQLSQSVKTTNIKHTQTSINNRGVILVGRIFHVDFSLFYFLRTHTACCEYEAASPHSYLYYSLVPRCVQSNLAMLILWHRTVFYFISIFFVLSVTHFELGTSPPSRDCR